MNTIHKTMATHVAKTLCLGMKSLAPPIANIPGVTIITILHNMFPSVLYKCLSIKQAIAYPISIHKHITGNNKIQWMMFNNFLSFCIGS